jgi:hypothetical protein
VPLILLKSSTQILPFKKTKQAKPKSNQLKGSSKFKSKSNFSNTQNKIKITNENEHEQ